MVPRFYYQPTYAGLPSTVRINDEDLLFDGPTVLTKSEGHVDNSLSDVQDLTGFSRPITDLFFEDVDPSDPDVRELLSYGVT